MEATPFSDVTLIRISPRACISYTRTVQVVAAVPEVRQNTELLPYSGESVRFLGEKIVRNGFQVRWNIFSTQQK